MNDHQKSKFLAVLVPEFMSSAESGEDSENEDTYTVRAIPWRSSRVDNFFDQLDGEVLRSMSKQSKRQLKKRILSEEHSGCPIPSGKFSGTLRTGTRAPRAMRVISYLHANCSRAADNLS